MQLSLQHRRLKTLIRREEPISLSALRALSWSGLPESITWGERSLVWKLLLPLVPAAAAQRNEAMKTKRDAYKRLIATYFNSVFSFIENDDDTDCAEVEEEEENKSFNSLRFSPSIVQGDLKESGECTESPDEVTTTEPDLVQLRQIRADLARTRPDEFARIFIDKRVQYVLTRCLYILALKNPACGYVQGMNDIVVPFFLVFLLGEVLSDVNGVHDDPVSSAAVLEVITSPESTVSNNALLHAEADTYSAMQLLLPEIQTFYIASQPGVLSHLDDLEHIIRRIDPGLMEHFNAVGMSVKQFAFRWTNCLLAREFKMRYLIRIWDTFMAEGIRNMRVILLYLSVALLMRFGKEMNGKDFQDSMLFIQNPPSQNWGVEEVKTMVAEAFVWKSLFEHSPDQFRPIITRCNTIA